MKLKGRTAIVTGSGGGFGEGIAKACAFLASDEADFITGVCMEVDGGRCV